MATTLKSPTDMELPHNSLNESMLASRQGEKKDMQKRGTATTKKESEPGSNLVLPTMTRQKINTKGKIVPAETMGLTQQN